VVDGGNSLGAIAAAFAMDRAVELAAEHGIGAVAVRGSNHCGAMAWIARRALDRGMIGLATTNALPTMAPWGGAERIIGINPLAIAIPAGTERPFVYDGAFSGSAHGKIRVSAQRGQPIPPDWATDRLGRPTTDPVAALDGLLLPIGGFKGVGLAMAMGILSSMLSGAAYGTELGDMERGPRAGQDGHFVAAIDVAAFEEPARFRARVDAAIRQVRQARRAPGVDRLYVPGEPEALARKRHLREGVPLTAATLADLSATAEGLGLVVDL
jgi:LDH2 family malate/lactate/ureidoglycolate dehydrogenase